jgi:hypothetical protein
MASTATIATRELASLAGTCAPIIDPRIALGEGLSEGMRVIVPLLLSLAMWAFILLGLAGLWLKVFGR